MGKFHVSKAMGLKEYGQLKCIYHKKLAKQREKDLMFKDWKAEMKKEIHQLFLTEFGQNYNNKHLDLSALAKMLRRKLKIED